MPQRIGGATVRPAMSPSSRSLPPSRRTVCAPGDVLDEPPHDGRVGRVGARQHVRGGALVDVQLRDLLGERRDELDGARGGTTTATERAGHGVVVVPLGGVEAVPRERLGARDAWDRRARQLPAGEDQHVGLEAPAVGGLERPAQRVLPPRSLP